MSEISIILPLYNGGKYIKHTINCVQKQTFTDWELLIVDDGSKDNGAKIAELKANSDQRIKIFYKANGGICSARNLGLQKAEGKYIAFIDQDDEPLPNMLKSLIKYIGDCDLVVAGQELNMLDEKENIIKTYIYKYGNMILNSEVEIVGFMLNKEEDASAQHVWNCLYKKTIIDNNRILFDEVFRYGLEDIMFNFEYASKCNRINKIDDIVYCYKRRIGVSTSTKINNRAFQDYKHSMTKMYDLLRGRFGNKYEAEFGGYAFRYLKNSFCNNDFSTNYRDILNKYYDFFYSLFGRDIQIARLSKNVKINIIYKVVFVLFRLKIFLPLQLIKISSKTRN